MQNFAYAVVIPLYLVVQLLTVGEANASNSAVDLAHLVTIIPALLLGYAFPTILMALPAPSIVSFDQKQWFVAFWQFFPVWVGLLQWGMSLIVRRTGYAGTEGVQDRGTQMRRLRWVYTLLLSGAALFRWSTLQFVATAHAFPGLFAEQLDGLWNFGSVFFPKALSPETKMDSVGEGAHLLLQYDSMIGNLAMVLWALVSYVRARKLAAPALHIIMFVMLCVGAAVLTGPIGLVVGLVWAKDDLVFAQEESKNKDE